MANYCTKCGTKLGKDDNFCTNCGTKINKQNIHLLKTPSDSIEKEKAKKELKKVIGGRLSYNSTFSGALLENGLDITNTGNAIKQQIEKEIDSGKIKSGGVEFRVNQLIHEYKIKKEEENKILKTIDEIFETEEIKSEIRKNRIDQIHVDSIKDHLQNKLIDKRENMNEEEIKHFIKAELEKKGKEQEKARTAEAKEKARIAEEMKRKRTTEKKMGNGGYCGWGCQYYREEILDSTGGIIGDYTEDMSGTYYYCSLGHVLVDGRFCEDYE
ncbi:zinc-ribbon domain-containing protein [Methanobrevibacter sp.]|uniref:zinc-ribbon domain-containing protein n=1 Tax=Methanobrevibacter sp. TaxID=66852 RepID=UPI0038678104